MTTIYNSSTGPKVITEMNPSNVAAALAKLERDDPSRAEEIAALRAQKDANDARLQQAIGQLKAAGFRSHYRYDAMGARQYWITNPAGEIVGGERRTEDAAWAKVAESEGAL